TWLMISLAGVRRRVKLLGIAYGLGVVVACAVALVLTTVALDYFLDLPAGPRIVVILGAVSILGYSLYRWVLKPAAQRLTLGDVAGRLEHAFPQFDDRLRSTVDIADQKVPGSEAMRQKVVDQATELAQQIDLNS